MNASQPTTPQTAGAQKETRKEKLCGRERLVVKEGRGSFVIINKEKVSLTKAKELDKEYRRQQKEKKVRSSKK